MSPGLGSEGAAKLRPKYRYSLLSRIGEGGMGDVFLAEQKGTGRRVAMKILKTEFSGDATIVERFLREAQATSQIDHPNVVEIVDVGRSRSGKVFFVMELLRGKELGELLGELGRLPWYRARGILLQIASALGAAHRTGVIHRDMKPDNVFLLPRENTPDFVKVLDFGIAKIEGAEALTQAGMVFGTAGYMAPEQVLAKGIDGRADIYALACMAFEMLTGRLPFQNKAVMKVLNAHLREPAPSARQIAPEAEIPAAVDEVILRALAKEPDERFADMAAFAAAIEAIDPGPAPPEPSASSSMPIEDRVTNQRTQAHVGPGALFEGRRPPTTGAPKQPPQRKAQGTELMEQPPPEVPSPASGADPSPDISMIPTVIPDSVEYTHEPQGSPQLARPQPPAPKRPSRPSPPSSSRRAAPPSQQQTIPPVPKRKAQATAMMARPPAPTSLPGAKAKPQGPKLDALAWAYLGLAEALASTHSTLPLDMMVKHLHAWTEGRPSSETRSLVTTTWSELMVVPVGEREARFERGIAELRVMPRAKAVELLTEFLELAGRRGPVRAAPLAYIVNAANILGVAPPPRALAIARLFTTLGRAGSELETRELQAFARRLDRWVDELDERERELIVRWALADTDSQAKVETRWARAYETAAELAREMTPVQLHELLADLWAIAEADGHVTAGERELISEVSRRFTGR